MVDNRQIERLEELERYIKDVNCQNERLNSIVSDLAEKLNRRFLELGQLTLLIEGKDRALKEKEQEIELYKFKLDKIKRTASWRLTAPLRIFGPFLSKNNKRENIKRKIKIIEKSNLFDRKWYLSEYQDVAESGKDPIEHYLIFGAREGRRPYAHFPMDLVAIGVANNGEENPLLTLIASNKKHIANK